MVPPSQWKHCPGKDNSSDLPSRGISMLQWKANTAWFNVLSWLTDSDVETCAVTEMPDECALELRAHECDPTLSLLTTERGSITRIIPIEHYSSLNRLFRATINILMFTYLLRGKEIDYTGLRAQAETLWIEECQGTIVQDTMFESWKIQLDYFLIAMGCGDVEEGCQMLAYLIRLSILYY